MDGDPLFLKALLICIDWFCIFSFPLLMRHLISESVTRTNLAPLKKPIGNFWDGFHPFMAVNTFSKKTSDLSLILFRKSISLQCISFILLGLLAWAWSGLEMGTFYIISTVLIFYTYTKSLLMVNELNLSKFLISTFLMVVSFITLFYISAIYFYAFWLSFNLFISPLYTFYLNKRGLKLDLYVFLATYTLNLFSFLSIAWLIKEVFSLVLQHSYELAAVVLILFLISYIPYIIAILSGKRKLFPTT